MLFTILKREDFIIKDGSHSENVILIVLEGSFVFSIGKREYYADKDCVIYFKKNLNFKRRVISPLTLIYIQFVDFPELKSGIIEFKDIFRKNGTIKLLHQAINANNEELCRHFSEDLYMQQCAELRLPEKIYSPEVSKFIDYVKENYQKKISVNSFTNGIFMSHTGFLLKFKRETGFTPIKYINSYRLKIAANLLWESNFSVGEIANLCGYENLYYFSNSFKKRFRISPTQYRNNNV